MKLNKISVEDNSGDKDFFTIIPNYILNHSTATDQALYSQLKRLAGDGKKDYCYPSFRYLKKQLKIGDEKIKKSLRYLTEHKWIDNLGKKRVMTRGGMQWVNAYKINNIWKLNADHYKGVLTVDPLCKVSSPEPEVSLKNGEVPPVVAPNKERMEELKKNLVTLLKDWNERQSSPIANFVPENIVKKHGIERIDKLIKQYGGENGGFFRFLQALKNN